MTLLGRDLKSPAARSSLRLRLDQQRTRSRGFPQSASELSSVSSYPELFTMPPGSLGLQRRAHSTGECTSC